MTFTTAKRAGEIRRRSLPSERLNMARSLLRPGVFEAGLIVAADFHAGHADGLAGESCRLTPADILAGTRDYVSYMLGIRAGELERSGATEGPELAGRDEED